MQKVEKNYIPAAGHHWALPFYDPILKLLGADRARRALIDQAELWPNDRVLDIGCGTGTLAVQIKTLHPYVDVVGLDPDPKALNRARQKAERAGVPIQFNQGFADQLPYYDGTFNRVFSSFMFHHLATEIKKRALNEVRRVLAPDGSLHLLDFGGPESARKGFVARRLHSSELMRDNFGNGVLRLMAAAGFTDPLEVSHRSMFLLPIAYYRASAA
jgi:ubiquinone/menaquinone biosynthesis C-methylase UbiE